MNILVDAVNFVDDDLVSEVYEKNRNRLKMNKYLAIAAVFAVVIISTLAAVRYYNRQLFMKDTGLSSEPVATDRFFGGADVTSEKISEDEVVVEGTGFTDEEIRKFVEEKKFELVGAVACEYENFDDVYKISTVGYCHVSLGETNVLKRDYVTLPITLNDKIIANITLFKSDGEMRYDIAVRGKSFDTLNRIFAENPESEIAFFYVDLFTEIAITPSNKIYNIYNRRTDSLKEDVDYYEKYKTEYNTFSLKKLTDENNFISVKPEYEENLANVDGYIEETEEVIQSSLVATTEKSEINISVADLFSKEIVSVEWGNGYDVLTEKPFEECTFEQAEKIKSRISAMNTVLPEEVELYFGGSYIARLVYSDGSFAHVILKGGNQVCFEMERGVSPIYVDTTGNASALAAYIVSLI